MWREKLLRRGRRLLIFGVVFYLLTCLAMWFLENRLVYPRQTAQDFWEEPPSPEIQDTTFPSDTSETIHGWYLPYPDSDRVLLLCHGNGGNLSYRGNSMLRIREQLHCSVLIFDYPGYGKSTGKPSEEGCYSSGRAALKWLNEVKGFPNRRVILYGESLGGGVAVELAKNDTFHLMILVKTFTSLPAAAKWHYPWLPAHTLMRNRFDNLTKIPLCKSPMFITSATRDEVVPFEHGPDLTNAATALKRFQSLEGHGHNDRLPDEFFDTARRLLAQHAPPN